MIARQEGLPSFHVYKMLNRNFSSHSVNADMKKNKMTTSANFTVFDPPRKEKTAGRVVDSTPNRNEVKRQSFPRSRWTWQSALRILNGGLTFTLNSRRLISADHRRKDRFVPSTLQFQPDHERLGR